MSEITVTSEKVPGGYIATATNGQAYTTTHRQNTAEDAERVAVRLFKDGVIDGYCHSDDMRSENLDDGSLNAPRQVVRYHEKRPHSLGAFLLAFVIVVVVVFLTCPAIMAVVGWLFRL